jgi:hypothetical protein
VEGLGDKNVAAHRLDIVAVAVAARTDFPVDVERKGAWAISLSLEVAAG